MRDPAVVFAIVLFSAPFFVLLVFLIVFSFCPLSHLTIFCPAGSFCTHCGEFIGNLCECGYVTKQFLSFCPECGLSFQ